jgi:hypothetical protein
MGIPSSHSHLKFGTTVGQLSWPRAQPSTVSGSHTRLSRVRKARLLKPLDAKFRAPHHTPFSLQHQNPHHTLLSSQYQMALADPHQVNDFSGEPFSHSIPHQPHNHPLPNALVSCSILRFTNARISTSILPQVPPAPANGQPGHPEYRPPQVRGAAGPDRVQYPHQFDVAYQGVVDYHPQPVAVSDSPLSTTELPLD